MTATAAQTEITSPAITIPYVDIRQGSPVDLMKDHKDKTIALVETSRNAFGLVGRLLSYIALPVGDFLSRRWLKKSDNPYRAEIEAYAKATGVKGVVAFNLSYEWGCTTGAFNKPGAEASTGLVRVLDWPFPALGENIVVAHQHGPAGDFHNVTWPGVSGIYNAVAAGRFSAALNQAPMRRHKFGMVLDWLRNRHLVNKERGLPPAHLLRKTFETAANYEEAKKMLSTEPVSIPVIYTLAGTKEGEGCVIERLENKAVVREMQNGKVFAANHFETELKDIGRGWTPRGDCSQNRAACATASSDALLSDDFSWFKDPVGNKDSRLIMIGDAAKGSLRVMGTLGIKPVTKVFRL